jgi:hypothetical protein
MLPRYIAIRSIDVGLNPAISWEMVIVFQTNIVLFLAKLHDMKKKRNTQEKCSESLGCQQPPSTARMWHVGWMPPHSMDGTGHITPLGFPLEFDSFYFL